MNDTINIIDLFSGAGGLTEGFRTDPYNIICHVEMDKDACQTLTLRNIYYYLKNLGRLDQYFDYIINNTVDFFSEIPRSVFQNVLNYEINKSSFNKICEYIDSVLDCDEIDGIIGGPPCQAYSTVGRARNQSKKSNDERIYLYRCYETFLDRYSPKFFIFENVKGLLSFKDCENQLLFPKIIKTFTDLGYEVSYELVNASLYGVPQNRERVIVFGVRKGLLNSFDFFKILKRHQEKSPTIRELFDDLPFLKPGESSSEYSKISVNHFIKKYYRNIDNDYLSYHCARKVCNNDIQIYKLAIQNKMNGRNLKYNELPPMLMTHSNKQSFLDRFKVITYDSVSHTIMAHIAKDGHYYIHPDILQNRSITVREAARIQGFPDDFYFEKSRTAAFKQIGNAVPPILSKKIAISILELLQVFHCNHS